MPPLNTRPMTPEEGKALADDLRVVLAKHGAELGVTSNIQLLKVIDEPVPSPIKLDGNDSTEKTG